MKLTFKPLTAARWSDIETLFGANGACGGCWCMWWRRPGGENWDEVKGATNKRRFRNLVGKGKAQGIIAYDGGEPVGWLAFGPRLDFPALARARTLKCDDPERVWSINCLFVRRRHRRRGVAEGMIGAAVELIGKRGGEIVEGYPVKTKKGKEIPDAFAFTGTLSVFKRQGFKAVGTRTASRQRVRLIP